MCASPWTVGAVDVLSVLLDDDRTEVDATDDVGETPLHLAAAAGRTLAALRLVEHGARVDVRHKRLEP